MRNAICAGLIFFSSMTVASAMPVVGKATFAATATPRIFSIDGEGATLKGDVQVVAGKATGEISAVLTNMSTGLAMRDRHMKEKYLDVAKFPEAKLVLKPWTVTATESTFEGDLTIKGETKPVKGKAKYVGKKLTAKMPVKISDYPAIGAPIYEHVGLKDEVIVSIDAVVE